mgnify:CR=1 FL=1
MKVSMNWLKDLVDVDVSVKELSDLYNLHSAEVEEYYKLVDATNLVVGHVVSKAPHPNADKLLVSKVNTKDKVRQIVSGISQYYTPEDMVGKKVVIVKNLKPVELRGVLSEGMLLAGKNNKTLEVLELTNLKPGDKIS